MKQCCFWWRPLINILFLCYFYILLQFSLFSSVQFSHSVVFDSLAIPWTAARQASLTITISWSFHRLMFIESVMPSNHLILCHPLLLPSIFLRIRVFSNESVLCIRCPKYLSLSFGISPSNVCSGLISFRVDWLDLLAVQLIVMMMIVRIIAMERVKHRSKRPCTGCPLTPASDCSSARSGMLSPPS